MKKLLLSIALFCCWTLSSSAATIMTYQGRLKESNLPVTGTRSFSFSICNSLSSPAGCTPSPDGAQPFEVANGLFKSTFTLPTVDLSAGPWYLEVSVGTPPASPLPLSPRELFTFVPYSVYALSASTASALAAASGPGVSASTNVIVAGSLAAGDAGVQLSTDAAVEGYAVLQNLSGTGVQDIRVAVEGRVYSQTTDQADAMAGGNFEAEVPAGKNGMLVGVRTRNAVDAAGSSLRSIGLMVDALDNKGSIVDTYGVYIASQTGGTQAHRPYALYSEDANAASYFAGNVGIGASAPAYALVVSSASGDVMWVSSYAVHALKFVGDGSGLSGVTGASGTDPNALHLTGGTMSGTIDMAGNYISGVSTITLTDGSLSIIPAGTSGNNYNYGISIGSNTYNNYSNGVGLGHGTYNNYSDGVGVGYGAYSNNSYGIGVGLNAYSNYNSGVGVGANASANYNSGVGVGANASGNANYAVGIGAYSQNNQGYGSALGAYSYAASSAAALGAYAKANAYQSVAIGNGTVNNFTGTASFGMYGIYTSSDVFAVTFHGNGSGLSNISDSSKLPLAGGTMTGSIDLSANPLLNVSSLTVVGDGLRIATSPYSGANGILVTPLGALQTQGQGVGSVIAGPRGPGAIDLQVMRTTNAQVASGMYAVVGGGEENTASQLDAVVPGGAFNTASGQYSFAAGYASQSTGQNTFTWQDSGGNPLKNAVNDRVVFKAKGGFLVTGSTIPTISATVNRGVFMTGDGRLGVSTGAPQAALDVVSTGTASNVYAQIWRDSNGNAVSSVTSQGYFYGNGSGLTGIGLPAVSTITIAGDSLAIVPAGTGGSNYAYGISIGSDTYDNYSYGVGMGYDASNNYNSGVGVGFGASGNNLGGVGVGSGASGNSGNGVGVGVGAFNNSGYGVGVGASAVGNSGYGVGVGAYSQNNQNFASAFGAYSYANSSGTALGSYARATAPGSVAIGAGTVNTSTGTASFGIYGIYTSSDVFAAAFRGDGITISTAGAVQTAGVGNGTVAGNPRGSGAVDLQTYRSGPAQVASGSHSVIGGGVNNAAESNAAVIAGGDTNDVVPAADHSFIGGGYMNAVQMPFSMIGGGYLNLISHSYAVIAGGQGNIADADYASVSGGYMNAVASGANGAFIGGGEGNSVNGSYAGVGGGSTNTASGPWAFVGAGIYNQASGMGSFVGAGKGNNANGDYSSVPGGLMNSAVGPYSFAAGYLSSSTAMGTFTWKDSSPSTLMNNVTDQVMFEAAGGFWVSTGPVLSDPGLYVTNGNKVGIGTEMPSTKLEVDSLSGGAISGFSSGGAATDAAVYGFSSGSSNASAVKGVSYGSGYAARFEGNVYMTNSGTNGRIGMGVPPAAGAMTMISDTAAADPYVLRVGTGTLPAMLNVSSVGVVSMPLQSMSEGRFTSATLTAASWTPIPGYPSVLINTHNELDPSTGKFTALTPGLYLVSGTVTQSVSTTTLEGVGISKNGALQYMQTRAGVGDASNDALSISYPVWLVAGDYVQLMVYSAAGNPVGGDMTVVKLN